MVVSGELYTLASKELLYPLNRRFVGSQSHPGHVKEVESFLPLLGFELACSLSTIQIMVYPGYQSALHITNNSSAPKYSI
jgi:hypothetical protein